MKTVSISNLKSSLSHYLSIIKSGEEVLVSERGKVFAKIVPLAKDHGISPYLRELEQAGLASIGSGKIPEEFWSAVRVNAPENAGVDAVLAEREESR